MDKFASNWNISLKLDSNSSLLLEYGRKWSYIQNTTHCIFSDEKHLSVVSCNTYIICIFASHKPFHPILSETRSIATRKLVANFNIFQ